MRLREARRQKALAEVPVPSTCILDPDGDLARELRGAGRSQRFASWPCYHTELDTFALAGRTVGIIGRAVGAPFAVLVAEQLVAAGCRLIVSLSSAGQIVPAGRPPYFVLIERAFRDEGTSHHYGGISTYADADPVLIAAVRQAMAQNELPVRVGSSWTTDAPFRETASAIAAARQRGDLAVEMEAAALYTFAAARRTAVVCLAHVTNTMGQTDMDFEKGEAEGTLESFRILAAVVDGLA